MPWWLHWHYGFSREVDQHHRELKQYIHSNFQSHLSKILWLSLLPERSIEYLEDINSILSIFHKIYRFSKYVWLGYFRFILCKNELNNTFVRIISYKFPKHLGFMLKDMIEYNDLEIHELNHCVSICWALNNPHSFEFYLGILFSLFTLNMIYLGFV